MAVISVSGPERAPPSWLGQRRSQRRRVSISSQSSTELQVRMASMALRTSAKPSRQYTEKFGECRDGSNPGARAALASQGIAGRLDSWSQHVPSCVVEATAGRRSHGSPESRLRKGQRAERDRILHKSVEKCRGRSCPPSRCKLR